MPNILCIHPSDDTTTFLSPIASELKQIFDKKFNYIQIEPNDEAHIDALNEIEKEHYNYILFLGHGGDGYLQGAKTEMYEKKRFIEINDLAIFKNKQVFCLSCNSNQKLGKASKNSGIVSFFGFGYLATDYIDDYHDLPLTRNVIDCFRHTICDIIKETLRISIKHCNFIQTVYILKLIINNHIKEVLDIEEMPTEDKIWIIRQLITMKNEIKIFGDEYARITQ